MRETKEVLEALVKLQRIAGPWGVLIAAWKEEHGGRVEQLLQGEKLTEYERAVLVGRARAIGDILKLAGIAPEALREFGTK